MAGVNTFSHREEIILRQLKKHTIKYTLSGYMKNNDTFLFCFSFYLLLCITKYFNGKVMEQQTNRSKT